MFYLLHGDDEFSSREHLKKLRQQGDFGFNQDTYDGTTADLKTIVMSSDTQPFLSEQRLIVIEGLPKRKRGESSTAAPQEESTKSAKGKRGKKGSKGGALTRAGFEKALAEHISQMPESTVLILLVDEALDKAHVLVKAADQHGKTIQSTQPKGAQLERWIAAQAKELGVKIAPDACALLANFIGNQLRLLANELHKLATYVGPGGTITAAEVRLLSAQVQEARIFDLTDALAQRNSKQALNILHDLLADGEAPLKLIGLITSQVRTLMLVKELAQKGMRGGQVASTLGIAPL
ncbi:DNA polymerase III subunit delta [Ktedonospora formicarum]|uniref:DNA polymerase III subunit delta n=1 Tax=Ktedonospora formicarum TaxID=2778364 RepID=A0A8J3MST0_9CHLR|nr:DNA polymerase III subunit delta [Ktedonospora formicarum]GHO43655.1 DNA polymerase III subunit delta [Ktedonospora formicarum]